MRDAQAACNPDTHGTHKDLLRGPEVPLDLTVRGLEDNDTIIAEDIEHIPHAEAWEGTIQPIMLFPAARPPAATATPAPNQAPAAFWVHLGADPKSGQCGWERGRCVV